MVNPIGKFLKHVAKVPEDEKDKDPAFDREEFDKVTESVSYHGRKIKDYVIEKGKSEGKLKQVTEWSGTRFRVTTKDSHEIWYTISDTDIRDKDDLNKLILTIRKYVSNLTLAEARRNVSGKTFSITEKLGNGSNCVYLLQLDGSRGLRPIITRNRYHDDPLGLGSAVRNDGQGLWVFVSGNLIKEDNGSIRRGLACLLNGAMRGAGAQWLPYANQFFDFIGIPKKWHFVTGASTIELMNKVAGEIVKYGKGDELWIAVEQKQRASRKWINADVPPVSAQGDLEKDLALRYHMLNAKRAKLERWQNRGLKVDENLKRDVAQLQEDVHGLHLMILFNKMDNGDQKTAVAGLGALWELRQMVRDEIAEEQLRPLDEQDTGEMDRREQRLQRAIDQIQEIVRLRTIVLQQEEPNPDHLEALKGAQNALTQFPAAPEPWDLDETMDAVGATLARVNWAVSPLLQRSLRAVGLEEDTVFDADARKHNCTIEQIVARVNL